MENGHILTKSPDHMRFLDNFAWSGYACENALWRTFALVSMKFHVKYRKVNKAMGYNTVTFRTRDSESDTKLGAFPVNLDDTITLAGLQTWVTNAIPIIEAVTDAKVVSVDATINLSAVASGNAIPTEGVYNERGANFLFDTDEPVRSSVFMPALLHSKMTGKDVNLADAQIEAFTDIFTIGLTDGTGLKKPQTNSGGLFTTAVRGRRGFRKK